MTTEQLHPISIPGLPKGWRAVAVRVPEMGEYILLLDDEIIRAEPYHRHCYLIVEKIKPRRVVLEETDTDNFITGGIYHIQHVGGVDLWNEPKIWRLVKEE